MRKTAESERMENRTPEQLGVQSAISNIVEWIRLGVETIGAAIVVIGVAIALWLLLTKRDKTRFNAVRLTLARYLALALEFQLAADILVHDDRPDVGQDWKTGGDCDHPDRTKFLFNARNEGSGGSRCK